MPRYSLGSAAGSAANPSNEAALAASTASTSHVHGNGGSGSDVFTANVKRLRRTWKFAAICQFLFTFEEAFGMSGFRTSTLEHDLAAATYAFIPDLMRRLLYTLTLDAKVTTTNWQAYLREQYSKRLLEEDGPNPLGTINETKEWESLTLGAKVRSIHDICEWQMADPERFRKVVRNEEEAESWRVYPIGYDAAENTYWLFDDNRLWIQRAPPPSSPKAKGSQATKKELKKAKAEAAAAAKKKRKEAKAEEERAKWANRTLPTRTSKRVASTSGPTPEATPNKRAKVTRSSLSTKSPASSITYASPRTRRHLRDNDEDGWEPIPPGLLAEAGPAITDKRGSADEDDSELSEPPDELQAADVTMQTEVDQTIEKEADESIDNERLDPEQMQSEAGADSDTESGSLPEYETVAVTRAEWETFATRWVKSKHRDEQALHKMLAEDIVPRILADIAEAEKAAALEAALAARKRSSRIAMKESEREEKEREAQAKAKMEERMRLIRQEEAEKLAKEHELLDEETKKEERLRGREERLRQREMEAEAKAIREIEERERREKMREMRKRKREMIAAGEIEGDDLEVKDENGEGEQDEDWDLGCEVCHKSAHNPELGPDEQIVCCESCLIWQHTQCWDRFDAWRQRSPRNWEDEDFFCTKCSARREPSVNREAVDAEIEEYRLARGLSKAQEKHSHTEPSSTDGAIAPNTSAPVALSNAPQLPDIPSASPSQHSAASSHLPPASEQESTLLPASLQFQQSAVQQHQQHTQDQQHQPLIAHFPRQQQQTSSSSSSPPVQDQTHMQQCQPHSTPTSTVLPPSPPPPTPVSGSVQAPSSGSRPASLGTIANGGPRVLASPVGTSRPSMTAPVQVTAQRVVSSPLARASDGSMGRPAGQNRVPSVVASPAGLHHPLMPPSLSSQPPVPIEVNTGTPLSLAANVISTSGRPSAIVFGAPPPRSPVHPPPAAPSSPTDCQAPGSPTTPRPQAGVSNGSNASARVSKNAGAAGSFPIRRPNTSVARSPLSGPSISPSTSGGLTPMSLGEALTSSGTIGLPPRRGFSPSPGARAARSLGPLSRPRDASEEVKGLGSTSGLTGHEGSAVHTQAPNGSAHKNLAASQPHGVGALPGATGGASAASPIVRPPPPGVLPSLAPGAVSPPLSPPETTATNSNNGLPNGSGPHYGSLAHGVVTTGATVPEDR